MTTQAFTSLVPVARPTTSGSSTCLIKKQPLVMKTKRTRPRRMVQMSQASPAPESSDDDANNPEVSDDWREFRAALIAGSAEELERNKENAYRPGHWAHSVCLSFIAFLVHCIQHDAGMARSSRDTYFVRHNRYQFLKQGVSSRLIPRIIAVQPLISHKL